MKYRLTAVAGAVALLAGTLAGCSASGGSNGGGGDVDSLNLWVPPFATGDTTDESAWDGILADFEDEHDVEVKVTVIPWASYEQKYLTGVSSGNGPDVGYMYTEMMGDYISKNAIVPLDDALTAADEEQYLYLKNGKFDGKQYAVPFVVGGARVMYYNKTLLAEAGVSEPPTTWDEFFAASEKLQAAGITPTVQAWGDPDRGMLNESFFPALWQSGGEILSADGTKTAFDSAAGLEAAKYILKLKTSGAMSDSVTSVTTDQARQQFEAGKVAFLEQPDAQAPTFTDAKVDWGFVPSLENTQKGTFIAADALVMLQQCGDQELCTDLIKYITAPEQMEQFHEVAAYPPISADEEWVGDTAFQSVYSEPEDLHNLPIAAGSTTVYNDLYKELQKMLLGQQTPAQALENAAESGDAALASAQ